MTKRIFDENSDYYKTDFFKSYFYTNNILTESFIEKHKYDIDWAGISRYQELSEAFIEKHANYVYWELIAFSQRLSNQFIAKHLDKLDSYFYCLKQNKYIDQVFVEKLELLQ